MKDSDHDSRKRRSIAGGLLSIEVQCYFCRAKIEDALNDQFKIISNPNEMIEISGSLCPTCSKTLKDFVNFERNFGEAKELASKAIGRFNRFLETGKIEINGETFNKDGEKVE